MPCKSDPAAAASDIDLFRESMARLAATVSIVTAELRGRRHGTTITAAMSLSLDPISILLSLHRGSATCAAIIETRKLCLNLLGPDHNELAQRFAGTSGHHGDARFDAGDWHGAPGEPPMLRDASAVLQCDLAETHAFGTHAVMLCPVRHVHLGPDREALVYANRQYGTVRRATASAAPTDQGI